MSPHALLATRLSVCLAACFALAASAAAQNDDPAGLPTELGKSYGFSGLQVSRFNDGLVGLSSGDLDGDGIADLAVINNGRSRLELLLRQREGEAPGEGATVEGEKFNELPDEAFFHRVSFPVDEKIGSLAVADMDGDGRAELLFLGTTGWLTIAAHGVRSDDPNARTLRRVRLPDESGGVVRVGDVDGDGRPDVLVGGKKDTWLVRQTGVNEFGEPVTLPNATTEPDGFELVDIDGDGKLDLLYVKLESQWPLRWRAGQGDGRFGRELSSRFASLRTYAVGDADGDGRKDVAAVRRQSGRVTLLHCQPPEAGAGPLALTTVSQVPFDHIADEDRRDMGLADLDGDGRLDLVVTEPSAARALVFSGVDGTPVVNAALLGASHPRLLERADGSRALVLAAPDEGAVGLAAVEASGRLGFPAALAPPVAGAGGTAAAAATGEGDAGSGGSASGDSSKSSTAAGADKPELLALDVAPPADGEPAAIWLITGAGKGRSRAYTLVRMDEQGHASRSEKLADLKVDPRDLWLLDLDRDGRRDALVFIPSELPRILLAQADGSFKDLNVAQLPGLGLLKGLERAALGWGDVDGDGSPELLVPGPNFARGFHLDAAGNPVVVGQFNLPTPMAQVACVAVADLDGDGRREVVLAERTQKLLYVLQRDANGESAVVSRGDLGEFVPRAILVDDGARGPGATGDRLVLAGSDRFGLVQAGAGDPALQPQLDFEVPVKNAYVNDLALGDVNGDGTPDLVMAETSRHQIAIAAVHPDALEFALRFRVYEQRLFESERGGQEPREVLLADVTGDGRTDLALLVHDRLIVYPQEGPP